MGGDEIDAFGNLQSSCVGVHNEATDALGAATGIGARENRVKIRYARIRNPGLAPIQNPVITVSNGATFHSRHIRSRIWFRKPEGAHLFTRRDSLQILFLLLCCSKERYRPATQPLHGKRKISKRIMPR